MSCRLPVELTDEIISYLWNVNPALEACSLTCRAMTLPSQKRLFHSVAIHPHPQLLRPPYTNDSHNATIGTFSKFRRLLDMSPHIAEYIMSLHVFDLRRKTEVSANFADPEIGEYLRGRSNPPWPDGFRYTSLPSYRPLLCKLKALTIVHGHGDLCQGSCSSLFPIFQQPSLLYLRILSGPYPIKTLYYAVGPNIKHLISLHHIGMEDESIFSDSPSSPVYLDTLAIDYPSVFVSSLMTNPACRLQTSRLRKLSIAGESGIENQHFATWIILQACSDTLEEFEFRPSRRITVRSPEEPDDHSDPIDLGKLISLKKFTVTLPSILTDQRTVDSYRWFSKIIRTANLQLEEISTHVQMMMPTDVMPWENICDVLLTKALKRLDIIINPVSPNKAETQMLVEVLNASKYIERLRSCQDLNVTVKAHTDFRDHTSPDIRWESWDRNLW